MNFARRRLLCLGTIAASGCAPSAVLVAGFFPEIVLMPPAEWPSLRITAETQAAAAADLRYSYTAVDRANPATIHAYLTLDSLGAARNVSIPGIGDGRFASEVVNALKNLRFYLSATDEVNEPIASTLTDSKSNVQAPPLAPRGRARSLPLELANVHIALRFVYREYMDYGRNRWQ
jgi:hypothetical protein